MDVRANNIICDTTTGDTKYKVYTGSTENANNKIYVGAKKYSSQSQTHIETITLDKLPQGYKVFYAIDLEDYGDNGDIDSDYQELTTYDEKGYYLEIGKDENTSPDSDVSFELRHYSDDVNYIAWDNEGILVDIISVQASYQLVCTPNSLFKDPDGTKNQSIEVRINRNVAGDGSPVYEPLSSIPEGYDLA